MNTARRAAPAHRVTCRRAILADAPLLQRLLPDAAAAGDDVQCFVAQGNGESLGVAALVCTPSGVPRGFRFALNVIEPFRRQGVGRALLVAVADEARQWDIGVLWPYLDVEEGGASAFLRAVGAVPIKRAFHFEGDAPTLHAVVRPLARRLRARLPANARIVALADAPVAQIAALHQQYLGASAVATASRATGAGAMAFSPTDSVALLVDGVVAGAVLYGWDSDVARIDALIVSEPYRRGWATGLLIDGALERGIAKHGRRIRFWCWEDTFDTMKLARRAGATVLTTLTRFQLDVVTSAGRA
jgi:GNAT superfamily N-acetyltransferase